MRWIAAACAAAVLGGSAIAADVPPRSAGMQTLTPSDDQLDAGEIFYLDPGSEAQLTILSDAPLLGLTLTTRRMVGYIVCPFEEERADGDRPPVLGGAFRLPAASLTGGDPAVDAGLRQPGLLDIDKSPEITFLLREVQDAQQTSAAGEPPAYTLTLVGALQINDRTLDVRIPAKMTHAPFAWQQMSRGVGDLIAMRFVGRFKLADAGLTLPQQFAGRLAEELELRGCLTFTTVSPDKSLDPAISQEDNEHVLRFTTWLRDFKDRARAYAVGRELEQRFRDNADRLHRLARVVLDDGGELRDLAFSARVADRAVELNQGADPSYLATQAEVAYRRGDLQQAREIIRRAAVRLEGQPPYVVQAVNDAAAAYDRDEAAATQPAGTP